MQTLINTSPLYQRSCQVTVPSQTYSCNEILQGSQTKTETRQGQRDETGQIDKRSKRQQKVKKTGQGPSRTRRRATRGEKMVSKKATASKGQQGKVPGPSYDSVL